MDLAVGAALSFSFGFELVVLTGLGRAGSAASIGATVGSTKGNDDGVAITAV
jgi:hypothetical protein